MPLVQLQVKLQKPAEITYLQVIKAKTRYRLTYLEVEK